MQQHHERFLVVHPVDPPKELTGKIYARIMSLEQRRARMRLFLYASATLGSIAGLFPATIYAVQEFMGSSALRYISLLASDFEALLPYWKELLYAIVESAPLWTATIVLALFFVLLWSLERIANKHTRRIFLSAGFA